ncbi:peptide chain release factor 2 [Neoehrlichia mikurensis]|uniref:Peptide chain release factor 2 n=1 Tax=Neoehrlichia mikurensis TaxID=89586 RepID=A0A9Q9F3M7_9RICK|nr:peptide chain release factor 2 [Neoehrlichia mikurensis]QXK92470.1 peptide chain release factor 2 [Neoehrlichia mikurensis]UTO55322.1 peptide chain release factor 2 [Neoehrlichia mikurensis]UTO56242.1 peptide chain release factor 2 [Neoehrlichia mikurensis]
MSTKFGIIEDVLQLGRVLQLIKDYLDIVNLKKSLEALEAQCASDSLWDDSNAARNVLQKKSKIQKTLSSFYDLEKEYNDYLEILNIVTDDDDFLCEIEKNLVKLKRQIYQKKAECLFSEEADYNDCFLEIHSGAGGTESNDWADMLLRMYIRWAEIYHKFTVEIVNRLNGEEIGIKSVLIKIKGDNAYGWAKTESGIHRLVRISPFDSNAKRHTSFASVEVFPVVDQNITIEINEKDLRIDTYRASGAGGQHINKTESAVRITYIPLGIVVQCQNNRSQHQNRAEAYNLLKSRLYEMRLQEKERKMADVHNKKCDIGWGNQIRSYIMHPYQMIKDLRTGYESSNVSAVLDGNLDDFITAALTNKAL